MHKVRWTAAGVLFALVVAFGAGLVSGLNEARTQAVNAAASTSTPTVTISLSGDDASAPKDLNMSQFWKAWNLLDKNFVESHASGSIPTYRERVYGAIEGLVSSYGDPYTEFFLPDDAAIFQGDISGSFGGAGMEIGIQDNVLAIVAPLRGSPAERAGIENGDKILTIDGVAAAHLGVNEAVKRIRGEVGTTVKLTIMRAGEKEPRAIDIVRETIEVPTIDYRDDPQNKIFEIDLYNFDAISTNKFREALRAYFLSGDTRLILDLRGNPGGYLDAAVDMASFFLPQGAVIVTEDYRGTQANIAHRSFGYNVFANKKLSMAILVDQGSASAAEILAGALQQHGVAVLIGTRTFGKGSVQQLMDLGGGAQLKVTVARWLTPNGTSISDGGLKPDINATTTVQDFAAGKDPQKAAAVQWLVNN